jgi:hypothetical protein
MMKGSLDVYGRVPLSEEGRERREGKVIRSKLQENFEEKKLVKLLTCQTYDTK